MKSLEFGKVYNNLIIDRRNVWKNKKYLKKTVDILKKMWYYKNINFWTNYKY